MPTTLSEAYITLVTTDSYVVGALVLAHSLIESGISRPIICLASHHLSSSSLEILRRTFHQVRLVNPLDSRDVSRLALLGRPELGPTFTKLEVWNQTDLEKVVFMDADMLVMENVDDLFEREELSACADVGWPDCFNSGLFVARPSKKTFEDLLQLAQTTGSFDGTSEHYIAVIEDNIRWRSRSLEYLLFRLVTSRRFSSNSIWLQFDLYQFIQLPSRLATLLRPN